MTEKMDMDHSGMLAVGDTLQMGKYRIERQLASGGFGNTYVVLNTYFNERYAMKEFFMKGLSGRGADSSVSVSEPSRPTFEEQRKKFMKEAQRLRGLHNEHVVAVHDLFEENGTSYYVMDFVDGESLSQRLKRTGKPLVESEALRVLDQVLDALGTVHEQGIWHLDLKPGNIMLDSHGTVKLIGLGTSKQMSVSDGYTSTSTAMCYTHGYAPSEQIDQNLKRIGPWTDLYALGATLYKLVTLNEPPILSELDEPDAFVYPASVSPGVRDLVQWMMSRRVSARPQSVQQVRDRLADAAVSVTPQKDDSEITVLDDVSPAEKVAQTDDEETSFVHEEKRPKQDTPKESPQKKPVLAAVEKETSPQRSQRKWLTRLGIVAVVIGLAIAGVVTLTGKPEAVTAAQCSQRTDANGNKVFTIGDVEFTMIKVEGGTFTMGATSEQGSDFDGDEMPTHSVTLSSYYIGQTEVTQALWQAVMDSNPSKFKGANRPVEMVSWDDCQRFISRLNELTGEQFWLPGEAQWEYAARGGNKSCGYKYAGSRNIDDVAWYDENSYYNKRENSLDYGTHNVATKRANELGLYDMSGNVYEWCQNRYESSSQTDYTGLSAGSYLVFRGGSWRDDAWSCRVSERNGFVPSHRGSDLGLRLVL